MTARTVTGNTILLTGSAQAGQTVTFKKKSATISGTVITQQGVTTATTDADGNFSKALDCPVSGSTSWALICPDGSLFDFDLPYGDGSSVAVTTLITAGAVEADDVTLLLDSYVLKSGSTMTGQLNFSGSTHAGLKLLTLTTAQRDALTPANGMVIYNSTTSTVQVYQGGAWASVGSGGAVSSVFGRTGAVVAAANDYAASEIEDDSQMAKASVAAALNTLDTSITNLSNNKQDADADLTAIAGLSPSNDDIIQRKAGAWTNRTMAQLASDLGSSNEYIVVALSDETTALTTGTAKATFRMPFAMTLTGVKIDVNTAPTGSAIQVDINEDGSSILSTKLTIDATEETSSTAATPAVISDAALANDAEITVDIDAVGSVVAGKGLKLTMTGTR